MLPIAIVAKPQGILGEVKVNCYLDGPEMLKGIQNIFIENRLFAVEKIRIAGKDAFFKIKGIDDRNAAELLRGKELQIASEDAPKLPEGRYFVSDVIGCVVISGGKTLGKIADILQNGSADVYVVQDGKKQIMFPALKTVLYSIDVPTKTVTVNKEEFDKVAVYED